MGLMRLDTTTAQIPDEIAGRAAIFERFLAQPIDKLAGPVGRLGFRDHFIGLADAMLRHETGISGLGELTIKLRPASDVNAAATPSGWDIKAVRQALRLNYVTVDSALGLLLGRIEMEDRLQAFEKIIAIFLNGNGREFQPVSAFAQPDFYHRALYSSGSLRGLVPFDQNVIFALKGNRASSAEIDASPLSGAVEQAVFRQPNMVEWRTIARKAGIDERLAAQLVTFHAPQPKEPRPAFPPGRSAEGITPGRRAHAAKPEKPEGV